MFSKILTCVVVMFIVTAFMSTKIVKAQALEKGLISYWTFDEDDIDGETVKDVMGNYDGTINGNPITVTGKVGEALLFNEKTGRGDSVDVGLEINEKLLKELTVEGWFNFAELRPVGLHMLMCAREGAWATSKGLSYLYCNNYNNEGFAMYFRLHHDGGPCQLKYVPFEPKVGEWYHFVATYDSSNINYFLNGENVATAPCPKGADATSISLKIAHSTQFGDSWDFIGSVDEVRLYNRALSDDEVKRNFAAKGLAVTNSGDKLPLTWGKIKVSR